MFNPLKSLFKKSKVPQSAPTVSSSLGAPSTPRNSVFPYRRRIIRHVLRRNPSIHVERVYAFIDSQNLNLGVLKQGGKLDFRKFRQYLKLKHAVSKAFLFIGYVEENKVLYDYL